MRGENQIISLTSSPTDQIHRPVRVSNNVLDMVPSLEKAGLNLIIAIIYSLQKSIIISNKIDYYKYQELEIEIPKGYITLSHDINLEETLQYLFDIKILFRHSLPGREEKTITRLISSITYSSGSVRITIPGDVVPWLIYCGEGVNYLSIEKDVFYKLQTKADKRLYLYIMSKTDMKNPYSTMTIDAETLKSIIGVGNNKTISYCHQKYLAKLCKRLAETGSKFSISYELLKSNNNRQKVGRKPKDRVRFTIKNNKTSSSNSPDLIAEMAESISKLCIKYGPKKTIGVPWLVEQIEMRGKKDEIYSKLSRLSKNNEKNPNYNRLANTIVKMLRADYEIYIN